MINVEKDYKSPEFRRSRGAYVLECAFEYFIALVVTDAFLAKLLKSMGASDALCGIISSFISLAFVFQLCSLFVVGKITNTKKTAVIVHTVSQLLFTSLYLIPFLPFEDSLKRPVFIVCMLTAYFGNYLVCSVIYRWGMTYVESGRRARFSAVKEMVSLASGVFVSLALGFAIDKFDESGNIAGGFAFTAICMAIFSICDFVCLMLIKNEKIKQKTERVKLLPVLKTVFKNRDYVRVVIIQCLYNASLYGTIGFLGTYKQDELAYTIVQIQIINIVGVAIRFLASRPFGKYSDKRSFYKGIMLASTVLAVGFAFNVFAAPDTRYFVIIFTLLYNVGLAGTSTNFKNITYSYLPEQYYVQASVIKDSVAGIVGFLATLVSGQILSAVQAGGNTIFGVTVYSQQILSAISLALICVMLVYMWVNMKKMAK